MAGPIAIQYLSARECQCEPSLTFYILLGATIFLAIVNVVGGLVFCVWRRARAHRKETWGPSEKSRLSVAALALPHPDLSRADVEAPNGPQPQLASEHVKVRVQVSELSDARSEYGPPPRRRSGAALLAKVLGMKRPSIQSLKEYLPRSPASSTRSRRSPLDPPYPPMPTSPEAGPSTEQVFDAKVVTPKPRTVSLYMDKGHKVSASGNHLVPPHLTRGNSNSSVGSHLGRGNSVRAVASGYPASTQPEQNSGPALSTIQGSPPQHRPPPLPLAQDNRFSRATLASPVVDSPSSVGHAPSALFSGVNAPRLQSYIWPGSEASSNTAILAYSRRESGVVTPVSSPRPTAPVSPGFTPSVSSVPRKASVDPTTSTLSKATKAPEHSTPTQAGLSGPRVSRKKVKLPSSPLTSPPIPGRSGSPVPTSAQVAPHVPMRQQPLAKTTPLSARRLSELPPPKYTRSSMQSHRRSMSASTMSTVDYVSGVLDRAVHADARVIDSSRFSVQPASPVPPGLMPPAGQVSQQTADEPRSSRVPESASWKKPHISRPSVGLTGPRGPRTAGLR